MGIGERSAYREGYEAGYEAGHRAGFIEGQRYAGAGAIGHFPVQKHPAPRQPPKKRKLSAWNKFVKANSKKPRFKYRTGKLNLKKMAVAFRKTPAGKKKRR